MQTIRFQNVVIHYLTEDYKTSESKIPIILTSFWVDIKNRNAKNDLLSIKQ